MIPRSRQEIEVELRVVFKQFAAWIHRFDGSIVKPSNIDKVRLQEASGVIVLSRLKIEAPDEEDSSNLMNIMAIKIACADKRMIVLLHRYKNKVRPKYMYKGKYGELASTYGVRFHESFDNLN